MGAARGRPGARRLQGLRCIRADRRPTWPKETLGELLKVAFGPDRFIRTMEHPVVKRLRGEA